MCGRLASCCCRCLLQQRRCAADVGGDDDGASVIVTASDCGSDPDPDPDFDPDGSDDCAGMCGDYDADCDCGCVCAAMAAVFDGNVRSRQLPPVAGAVHACAGCCSMLAAAFDHIRNLSHSYNARNRVKCNRIDVDADAGAVLRLQRLSLRRRRRIDAAVAPPQRDSLNVHWQFQEVSRSSVKARCSGRQVLADEGDGAQRQRSGPGVYFGRRLKIARMQLQEAQRCQKK